MKKIIPILMLSFLAAGCYEEILIPTEDKDPVLVMNAQMDNLEKIHVVHLSRSLLSKVEPFSDATVRVFVNGTFVTQAVETYDENAWNSTPYAFEAEFHPGDEVRIEASKGAFTATATAIVPAPAEIEWIKVYTAQKTYMDDVTDYYQLKVHFKDLPGNTWYGVDQRIDDVWEYLDGEGNVPPGYIAYSGFTGGLETDIDPVISEGAAMPAGDGLMDFLSAGNYYNCFSDTPIADQECTLTIMVYANYVDVPDYRYWVYVPEGLENEEDTILELMGMPARLTRTAYFRLRTMDFSQYHYLKALNNLETFGTEVNFLVEPTTLPSNVEGGLGFVGIETITEMSYSRLEREYEPVDDIYYYY